MVKTYDYIIQLKKPSFKLVDSISKLMLVLSIASFLFVVYMTLAMHRTALAANTAYLLILFSVLIFGWILYCNKQIDNGQTPYYRFALMFAAWGWFVIPNGYWITLIYIVACFLEKPIKVLPEIAFDKDEIVFNSFPKKSYLWTAMNNVVLKDGLITLDFKTNTIVQKAVDADVSAEVEQEFNAFCKEALEGA